MLLDCTLGKYAHAHFVPNRPFSYVTIWVTAMIRKSTDAAILCRVDELWPRTMRGNWRLDGKLTDLVLLEHHEVEMSYSLLAVLAHALLE